jgi:hypothetical protein
MALSWADRWLLVCAAVMLLQVKARLGSTRFRPDPDRDAVNVTPAERKSGLERARKVARLVNMAARGSPVAFTCLHRSLATWQLLRREGIPCRLRLGASDRGEERFEAHAWVEFDGVAVNERTEDLAHYRPFERAVMPGTSVQLPIPLRRGAVNGRYRSVS